MAVSMIFSISISNVYAAPMSPEFTNSNECWTTPTHGAPGVYETTCCWTVVDAEGIELEYCQNCNYDPSTKTHSGCSDVYRADMVSPDSGRLPPGDLDDTPILEQPPTENEPPIKSGDSVLPNEDSNVIDEQQTNTNTPLTNERVPSGNLGVLEQLEDSSDNQNDESGDSVSSENPGLFNVVPQDQATLQQP